MNSTFKRNLFIGYGISLVLLAITAIASYVSIRNLLSSAGMVAHTNEVIRNLDDVILATKEGEGGQRGYLLSGDKIYLIPYNGAYQKATQSLQKVRELTRDNEQQQTDVVLLKSLIDRRFTVLQKIIDAKDKSGQIPAASLEEGRRIMEQIDAHTRRMQQREEWLLEQRTASMKRFANATPAFIIIASIISLLVTIISFFKINADFEKRIRLQKELEQKDKDITNRINIIQSIASSISAGDYTARVDAADNDVLGSLGGSLNKMAESLDYSFDVLAANEWHQKGIAQLNEKMLGEKDMSLLTHHVIDFLTEYTKAQAGAFYLAKDESTLMLLASMALDKEAAKKELPIGEGIAGQSAQTRKTVLLDNLEEAHIAISYAAGCLKPKSIIAIPVFFEGRLKGVIELAALNSFDSPVHDFLKTAAYNIGMAIHSVRDHQRLEELLAETQAQSEELQAQHSEMENINAELEAQAEKLQASEEELRVQQEELQQANAELEERSRLLEERNELILERNLEIQANAEELAASTKYKSEFLANMSHELRTPLNSILLLSRLLSENHSGNLAAEQIEYASVIQSSGTGLLSLIDEILDLSKIESGKMELEYSDVRLSEITGNLRSMFQPLAKDKGIEFVITQSDDAPQMIETDRLRVEQILRNFISNALKFTKRGSVALHITKEAHAVSFAVKDTGIGIPKDKQQTIFEAFQQADGSTRRKYGGTGLGLSISRELARLLGGKILLESEEGKGSIFTLSLPLQKEAPLASMPQLPTAVQATPAEAPAQKALTPEQQYIADAIPAAVADDRESIAKGDKVILIVEDDTAFAGALLDYTRKKGYKGVVAVRGDEGIALAKRYLPLGVLLDIQLPVKSGWEVMEELKSDPATKPIPVHIMSSHEVKTKSLSKGAVDFINKPVAFEKLGEMFQKIEQALSRHPKKVLIVEENTKHAQALSYFLQNFNVASEIKNSVNEGIEALHHKEIDCVILDMGVPAQRSYDTLEEVKKTPGLENLPIIIFTGKNLSHIEEMRIKKYADSIVIKTAHSYQRILDEVSLFLHLVEEHKKEERPQKYKKMGELSEVLRGKTVLVADDDVRNIFSLTKSLESYGMNVVSAVDGKEALKQLEESGKVDLVLMDMMMPEMDGYEAIKNIRGMQRFRNLPIIAVTAKAMTGDREKCIAAGASDYITKPVDLDQLMSLLRVWLYEL